MKGGLILQKESKFQSKLIKELKTLFPGSIILKTNPNYIQGFPDLIILFCETWAALECKRSEISTKRPNQDHYVELLKNMSYASFVDPENKEEVLNELQQTFKSRGSTRLPRRK